jgi:hypothetical protein
MFLDDVYPVSVIYLLKCDVQTLACDALFQNLFFTTSDLHNMHIVHWTVKMLFFENNLVLF